MGGVGKIKKKLFVFNQALASDQDSEVDVTNCTFPHKIDKREKGQATELLKKIPHSIPKHSLFCFNSLIFAIFQ